MRRLLLLLCNHLLPLERTFQTSTSYTQIKTPPTTTVLSAVNNYLICHLLAVWRPVLVATGIEFRHKHHSCDIRKESFEPTLCLFQSIHSSQNIASADTSKKTFLEVTKVSSITFYFEPSLTAAQSQNCDAHICQMHDTAAWPCQNKRPCAGHFSLRGANISYLKSEVKLVQISMNERVEAVSERWSESAYFSLLWVCLCPCVSVGQRCKHYSRNG